MIMGLGTGTGLGITYAEAKRDFEDLSVQTTPANAEI